MKNRKPKFVSEPSLVLFAIVMIGVIFTTLVQSIAPV